MATMRAAVVHRHGGPQVIEVREVPVPVPAAGEVRVKVAAAALNRADLVLACFAGMQAPASDPSACRSRRVSI